jgi:hypothetical protein
MSTDAGERFEVRTDRQALRRFVRWMTVFSIGTSVVYVAALGTMVGLTIRSVGGFAVPMAGGALLAVLAYFFGRYDSVGGALGRLRKRQEIDVVLVLDQAGLWMPVPGTAAREVRLPWSAVGDVRIRRVLFQRIVSIAARPGVTAEHPGTVGLDDPRVRRYVYRPGLALGTRFTNTNPDAVVAAIHRLRH